MRPIRSIRGALYGGPDYYDEAERELMLVVMIETAEGIANADEIFAVDGVDGCLIGTNAFSLALGLHFAHAQRDGF